MPRRRAEHHRADLDRPYPSVPVKFHRQRLAGKLVRRDVRQHAGCVDIDGVAAGRLDDRHAAVGDVAAQVTRGSDPVAQVIGMEDFLQAHRDGIQVAAGQPAVSREALGEN